MRVFLQRLMSKEQRKEGKLVSSIESLTFSSTNEEDVVITIKDVAGWQLNQTYPLVMCCTLMNRCSVCYKIKAPFSRH